MSARHAFRFSPPHIARAVGIAVLLAMGVSGTALGQQRTVSGTVTSQGGAPLQGVVITVQGTDTRTQTNATGKYVIQAPADATLSFTRVGQHPVTTSVGGRIAVDVSMAPIAYLEEVVVTAYTEQRRADITGAVASVNIESADRQSGASVLQRLDAAVPGITVAASGSPGARSTVRIRGISSFQNNDPLYVVDGTPVQDSYVNFLNPDDITSIQVLKDASAASIYGARASNGVIVIETTRRGTGGPPQATFRVRNGISRAVKGYDDILITNALDYAAVQKAAYENAGQPVPTNIYGDPNNPTVPAYIYAEGAATDQYGRPINVNLATYGYPNSLIMPGSAGTNWWKSVFGTGKIGDYNLDVRGGTPENTYNVSFNYFDQYGTAAYNRFQRGSVRANTAFTRGKINFGENIALSRDQHYGGMTDDNIGEGTIVGRNMMMQPVVPVYDVQGNFAGAKAVGLGNTTNPLKIAFDAKDDLTKNNQMFGNMFGGVDFNPALAFKSRLGFNIQQNSGSNFTAPSPEVKEATYGNAFSEFDNSFTEWTWTNTLRYAKTRNSHSLDVLVGQEANKANFHGLNGQIASLINTDLNSRFINDALGDPTTKNTNSFGSESALLSFFGKAGYTYADKYVASFTLRKDGSSRLGETHRWGTFPAVGLGWRITNESFLANNNVFSDVMLRYGWGVTGNQLIPSGRTVSSFGGSTGDTFYDVGGSNSIAGGFRQTSLGNTELKWEENRSQNVGADMSLFKGMFNVVIDVYQRNTNNLLFNPAIPATQGVAAAPIVNIGKMKNTGIDFSIGHQAANWNATFNGSHYKNEIVSIDGVQDFFLGPVSTRFGRQTINKVGFPIGSFYGYQADGFFRDAADVASHAKQDGAQPGRIKFRDVNGDGKISSDDQTIIGSPHPSFTGSLDLGARRGNFDVSATVFGTFGNKIFDVQKEDYVFRDFAANVRKDLLANSWTPTNLDAKYPRIDNTDSYSRAVSSFYVEDGSYTRLRNVQLGYNVPPSMTKWLSATRIYLQGENLFTKTNYGGLDPSLPVSNTNGAAGDLRDQYRGVDRGVYPSSKTFTIGLTTSF